MSTTAGPEKYKSPFYMDPENLDAELSKVPLFMSHLPEEDNATLSALQSLAYDGTPEEIAENFKNQGNDCFRQGKATYKDAIEYYTKAIDTDCSDKSIMEACYANRAAVNLELSNYGRVLRDCAKCLELNPKHVKALYRSARALYALDRVDEAHDCCAHGLAADPENQAVKKMLETCVKRKEQIESAQRRKEEKEREEKESKERLQKAFEARKIKFDIQDKEVRDTVNIQYDAKSDTLSWPVFFLYPEHKESDYIQSFDENDSFNDHLQVVFEQQAPWDTKNLYTADNVEVFFEKTQGLKTSLIKVGKKLPLGKILSLPSYTVVNGIPSFIIMAKNSPTREEFLKKYSS
ncbi:hypothetical protein DFQ28_002340 [Apophysomyces sp. BC1034]|nr:hypothetical protein DFQ30_001022 [Apophysomyces sp. BC1015]KAG0183148.1 hypothetical protein DFQ29_009846 [Apophysomyces sp. BC1021]KAG0193976.1 hypothetical protein DFQ28_002340 [Apophysomyces sp. BC1034]